MNTDYRGLKIVHLFVTYSIILCYWWRNSDVS